MIIPEDEIIIMAAQIKIAIRVLIISAVPLKSKDGFTNVNVSLKNSHTFRNNIHIMHSVMIGIKTNRPAIIPNAPTPDFKSFRHPPTVIKASLTALPTIGIHVSINILAPITPILSAEEATIFWSVSIPTNMVDMNFITVFKDLYA